MLAKLVEVPALCALLPFVKTEYSRASSYVWADEEGVRLTIEQHEGGEQGDPLIPLLFSLGIQNAFEKVQLHTGKTRTWNFASGSQTWKFLDLTFGIPSESGSSGHL